MKSTRLEFFSSLSPSLCATRLSNAIDHERLGMFSWTGTHPVAGRVDGTSFRIRKRIPYWNPFQTMLAGSMQPHGPGAVIRGQFGLHRFTSAFMFLWFSGFVVKGIFNFLEALITLVSQPALQPGHIWVGLIVPALMLTLGVVVLRFGRSRARDENLYLLEFLRGVLEPEVP